MDAPRFAHRLDGIDHDDVCETFPIADQCENVAGPLDDANSGRQPLAQPPGDRRSEAVVAAVRVADAGDQDAGCAALAHPRWTRSVKKCAAQEMHGS